MDGDTQTQSGGFEFLGVEAFNHPDGHGREERSASWDHTLVNLQLGIVEVVARAIVLAVLRCAMSNPRHHRRDDISEIAEVFTARVHT